MADETVADNKHTEDMVTVPRQAFDDATLALENAHGVVDLVYTMACENRVDFLCEKSLAAALHTVMCEIEKSVGLLCSR